MADSKSQQVVLFRGLHQWGWSAGSNRETSGSVSDILSQVVVGGVCTLSPDKCPTSRPDVGVVSRLDRSDVEANAVAGR